MRPLSRVSFSSLALALSLSRVVTSSSPKCYKRALSIVGSDFFDQFDWVTEDDPTHGRVNYLSLEESKAKNLTYATEDKFFMFPDSKHIVNATVNGTRGRDSNRISSKQAFDESVVILDLQHMPYGCATWPAFWSFSQTGPWPTGGEIDVIEGVNTATQNLISLHTLPNCTMPQNRTQTGMTVSTNCDAAFNFNQGCGTRDTQSISYGQGFNSIGGGIYALVRDRHHGIKVWFWPRSWATPFEVQWNEDTVTPSLWGPPTAFFPTGNNCHYDQHFNAHNLIFDLTFCGDWAGNPSVWAATGCASTNCSDFVDKHPQAFADAYWEVNSLRVYVPEGN